MLEKIGGRKFLMALITIGAGIVVELMSRNGLSANMVALLGAIYATFSTANAYVTGKAATSAPGESEAPSLPSAEELAAPAAQAIGQLHQSLSGILNQVGAEIAKTNEVQVKQSEALATVQSSLAAQQKALAAILSTRV